MKKGISILMAGLALCAISVSAQEVKMNSKFGMELQQHLATNINLGKNSNNSKALTSEESSKVKVLVSLVPTSGITAADLEAVGCEVKWAMKSVASVVIAEDQLEALAAIDGVRNINLPRKGERLTDKARSVVFVDDVEDPKKAVAAGLPHEYDGTGVLVGIIDGGIDFKHYAFTDKEGKTRIQRAWTKGYDENGYFESLVAHTTPDEILKAVPATDDSHGSHVLGIMTGRELGNNRHGMAPNTGIVAVDCDVEEDQVIQGMKNICDYAASVNMPVVINMSLGGFGGLPDGCDPISDAIVELTDNGTKSGVIFAVAAGNEGEYKNFVHHTFTSDDEKIYVICDTVHTVREEFNGHYVYAQNYNPLLIQAWTDHVVDNKENMVAVFDLDKKVMIEDPDTEVAVVSAYSSEEDGEKKYHFDAVGGNYTLEHPVVTLRQLREMLKEANWCSNKIHTCNDGVTQKNEMYFSIIAGSRVRLFENLRFGACFSYPAGTEILVGNFSGEKKHARFIKPEGFDRAKESTSNGTINLYACNNANITTGNYCSKPKFTNYFEIEIVGDEKEFNDVVEKSSYGITFNEQRLHKPDVLAPGRYIESTTNNYYKGYFPEEYGVLKTDFTDTQKEKEWISSKVRFNEQDYWYEYMSGTSQASPVTAGVIALWLQANPNLCVADVFKVLENSCTPFKSPNESRDEVKCSRFGIINALEGLKYIQANMTGICTISQDSHNNANSRTYNLYGIPVGKDYKGVVIKNGKKIINN